jgi:hypothetical protein
MNLTSKTNLVEKIKPMRGCKMRYAWNKLGFYHKIEFFLKNKTWRNMLDICTN